MFISYVVSVEPDLASQCNFLMGLLVSENPATKFCTRVIFVVEPAKFAVFKKFSPLAAGEHQHGHPLDTCCETALLCLE